MKFRRRAPTRDPKTLPAATGVAQSGADAWDVIRGLLVAELERFCRRLLRRPEPPRPFAGYRQRHETDPVPHSDSTPPPTRPAA